MSPLLRPARLLALVALAVCLLAPACSGDGGDDAAAPPPSDAGPIDGSDGGSGATTATSGTTPLPGCSTADWSLDRRIRNLVFASLSAGSRAELDTAVADEVGGVFVTSAAVPLVSSGELTSVTGALDLPPLVSIDEEGGRVQRLRDVLPRLPSAQAMAEQMSPEQIQAEMADYGASLHELGITMDSAPVVDVTTPITSDAIGDRSFGSSPEQVTADAGAFARGLLDAGVLPTLKHFPGQGSAAGDSHEQLVTTVPLAELGPHLEPYRQLLAELPRTAVMVGHLRVPGLTGDEPATVSRAAITGLLRDELGFDGLVLTDDLGGMEGILAEHPTPEAAALAVEAGADMPLVPIGSVDAVVASITDAVATGALPESQITRSSDRVLQARSGADCG